MNPSATQRIFRISILVVSTLLLFSSVALSAQIAAKGRLRNHHIAKVMKGNKSNNSLGNAILEPISNSISNSNAGKSSKGSKSKSSKANTATLTTTTNSTTTGPTSTATLSPTSRQSTITPANSPTSSPSTSTPTSVPTSQPTNTNNSSLKNDQTSSLLVWKGVRRCSSTTPCPACFGDCDTDDDCMDGLMCYKRIGGSYATVPGCDTGGFGDVGGGDYCYYNMQQQATIPTITRTKSSFAKSGRINEDNVDDVFTWRVAPVSRLNEPTVSTTYTPTNAFEKDGDDDNVFAWREDVEN